MKGLPIFYGYSGCGTCRKALAWLKSNNIAVEVLPIRDRPPSKADLKKALLQVGALRPLFNTSGGDYRELELKDKLSRNEAKRSPRAFGFAWQLD